MFSLCVHTSFHCLHHIVFPNSAAVLFQSLRCYSGFGKLLDPFLFSSERLVKGIFVKIKPNCLSSGDIALASSLISTCLSTDELLLSGTRVVEDGPITRGQTYKNNIDSL